jgi:tetratricopeptide (TPR) repeat protein
MYRMTEPGLDRAVQMANQALIITGPNAALYATLGQIHFHSYDAGVHRDAQTLEQAAGWARLALELDPSCAPAFLVKGLIEWNRGDMRGARSDFRRSAELGAGGEALVWLAYISFQVGAMAEGRRALEQAKSVDPLFWFRSGIDGVITLMDGDFETAASCGRNAVQLSGGEPIAKIFFFGTLAAYAGHYEEAGGVFAEVANAKLGIYSEIGAVLGAALHRDASALNNALKESRVLMAVAPGDKECSWFLADAFALVGDYDEALRWLKNAIHRGFCNHRFWSDVNPFFAPLRDDPRFQELMQEARTRERAFET